jgi:hypothetical protein
MKNVQISMSPGNPEFKPGLPLRLKDEVIGEVVSSATQPDGTQTVTVKIDEAKVASMSEARRLSQFLLDLSVARAKQPYIKPRQG